MPKGAPVIPAGNSSSSHCSELYDCSLDPQRPLTPPDATASRSSVSLPTQPLVERFWYSSQYTIGSSVRWEGAGASGVPKTSPGINSIWLIGGEHNGYTIDYNAVRELALSRVLATAASRSLDPQRPLTPTDAMASFGRRRNSMAPLVATAPS